jgi:hypothetical protein
MKKMKKDQEKKPLQKNRENVDPQHNGRRRKTLSTDQEKPPFFSPRLYGSIQQF